MDDRPLKRPYARIELERRFLLEALPPGVAPGEFDRLRDTYVHGTHLRIRHVHRPDGEWVTTKLGQKVVNPAAPKDARQRMMTTIYLPREEAAVVAALPGLATVKRRYKLREQGRTWCVDLWEEPSAAAGTILAEVETDILADLEALTTPDWAEREVTDDPRFTSIALAQLG